MAESGLRKYWWVIIAVAAVLAVATTVLVDAWQGEGTPAGAMVALGLLAIAFCWVYVLDPDARWWAIIPGMALFTVIAAILADLLVGTGSENDWVNVLVLGAGVALIATVVKRPNARAAIIMASAITLLVGILMAPFSTVVKVVLAVVAAGVGFLAAWRVTRTQAS